MKTRMRPTRPVEGRGPTGLYGQKEDLAIRGKEILRRLERQRPDARIALRFSNPLELLVATILSAQCTDERVNRVTATLFKQYRTAADYAKADPKAFETAIRSTGFYQQNAKNIIACCRLLVEKFKGKVPDRLEDLVTLPGVGRKTANIVLGNAYGQQAIAVDTHVRRVSQRLGLTDQDDPDKIEQDLNRVFPESRWTLATNLLILHGREVCQARKPLCGECALADICPSVER